MLEIPCFTLISKKSNHWSLLQYPKGRRILNNVLISLLFLSMLKISLLRTQSSRAMMKLFLWSPVFNDWTQQNFHPVWIKNGWNHSVFLAVSGEITEPQLKQGWITQPNVSDGSPYLNNCFQLRKLVCFGQNVTGLAVFKSENCLYNKKNRGNKVN